jgi:hypothetical protein
MGDSGLFLGQDLEGRSRVGLDPDHLTTHAVCVGMTGSGKTGLGIVALEELARRGTPLLVIDLKGDMVNLLLNFPSLAGRDFEPWLTRDAIAGRSRAEAAEEQAGLWRKGLEGAGLGAADMSAVRGGVGWRLLTPGAAGVAPMNIVPSLSAPAGWNPESDPDGATEKVGSVAGALLSLVGRGGDPLTDRDQVLVASILLEHWRRGDRLDLAGLLASVADPPMAALGALPVERFYPRDERMKLVLELNALLASPAFGAWTTGAPLAMEELLGSDEAPRASIVSIAHLDERQRLFIIALLASELVAWMRRQPGTGALRALLYIDELQGILPPHPANPPTKPPLMTLLKQGRAFGVGVWLATQNPVDVEYKALGNAGVAVIGRLVTERDRERVLDGLALRALDDGREVDPLVAALGKREFLLHDVAASPRARTFASRWAMSYLRGPVTLAEMRPLVAGSPPGVATHDAAPDVAREAPRGGSSPPVPGRAIAQRFEALSVGRAQPALLVRSTVRVARATLGLELGGTELWRIPLGEGAGLDWEAAERLEKLPPLLERPPDGMEFPAALPGRLDKEIGRAEADFASWRVRSPLTVLVNRTLKLTAAQGENRAAFEERCLQAADRADDAAQERARARYEARKDTLARRLASEREELERDRGEVRSRKAEEVLGVVEGLFSVLMGSRSLRSAGRTAASRARTVATKRRMSQRAEGAVGESQGEIERLEAELAGLAEEMQAEVDRIAAASEAGARAIEEDAIRPKRSDVTVEELLLVWS